MDMISDWVGGVALAVSTAIIGWLVRIGLVQQKHGERIAVTEHQVSNVPTVLHEIRDEIRGLKTASEKRQTDLYNHIERFRLEVKSDLSGKLDRT